MADMDEGELIQKAPQLIKICSAEGVGKLVQRALPGMELSHLQVPPFAGNPLILLLCVPQGSWGSPEAAQIKSVGPFCRTVEKADRERSDFPSTA